jgi:hypothetical protein
MQTAERDDLIYQALETELGGVEVYEKALECAVDEHLRAEWQTYLAQTRRHVEVMQSLCQQLGLDPERDSPSRIVIRHIGRSLVKAMDLALTGGPRDAAQIVAAECVVLAETKDHLNWELIGELARHGGEAADALRVAHEAVEEEEDEHLYHTGGWTRELWIKALGMRAVLPPPEERRQVKTATDAEQAKDAREQMG